MAYTNIDDPSAHFQTLVFTGTGGLNLPVTHTNTGNSDLQPDLIWFKDRGAGYSHAIMDSSRGRAKVIYPDVVNAEVSSGVNDDLVSFDTDGFKVGAPSNANSTNGGTTSKVAWQWKANAGSTTSVSASGTGSGCVNACTHQANTTAGFSIITYTGRDDQLNNGQHSILKHGLGVAPTLIILKRRDASADWYVMGKHVTSASAYSNNEYLSLNDSDAINGNSYTGSIAPTSTDIYLGNELVNVASATYIMYAFADIQGYSKFGKYAGNANADGSFIYTGFKPALVIIKVTTNAGYNWWITDNKRNPQNEMDKWLFPDLSNAEYNGAGASKDIDFLSNGFKLRASDDGFNGTGKSYIYMAFAENPFVTSTGIPTTAR